jgi:hypothetical protein
MSLSEQWIYLWYPANAHALSIVSVRKLFTRSASDALVLNLIDHQVGKPRGPIPVPTPSLRELPVPPPNAGLAP